MLKGDLRGIILLARYLRSTPSYILVRSAMRMLTKLGVNTAAIFFTLFSGSLSSTGFKVFSVGPIAGVAEDQD